MSLLLGNAKILADFLEQVLNMKHKPRNKDSVVKLKTNRVDVHNLKEKATREVADGRQARYENPIIAADKALVAALIEDHAVMMRALKRHGVSFERPLHYSEAAEWKAQLGKPTKRSEVPTFLRKELTNRKRERL